MEYSRLCTFEQGNQFACVLLLAKEGVRERDKRTRGQKTLEGRGERPASAGAAAVRHFFSPLFVVQGGTSCCTAHLR